MVNEKLRIQRAIGYTAIFATLIIGCAPILAGNKKPAPKNEGEQAFKQYCASCHTGGGNTVKASKPIAASDKLNSVVTFKEYLKAPPGHMPYYKQLVADQKLLNALYEYCKTLKPAKQA